MRIMLKTSIAAGLFCLPASFARAGDQGDPAQACNGNTFQMVECLKAQTRSGTSGWALPTSRR